MKDLLSVKMRARALGEFVLVPEIRPIFLSQATFFNTPFSMKMRQTTAIGAAFATSVVDGAEMSDKRS